MSSVAIVTPESCACEKCVHFVWADTSREADVAVDRAEPEAGEIPARQAFEKAQKLGLGNVRRTAGYEHRQARGISFDELVGVAECEPIVRVDVDPPEHVFLPGCERVGTDGANVHMRHQTQQLQVLLDAHEIGKTCDDVWIFRSRRKLPSDICSGHGSGTPREPAS